MNLLKFAKIGGCRVVVCGAGYGGRYGYTTEDAPNCTVCGFKTKKEAREQWVVDTFGNFSGEAVLKLLAETK